MSNFVSKNHKVLAIIGGIIIISVIVSGLLFGPFNAITITLIIIIPQIISVIVSGLLFGPFNAILPDSLRERLGYDVDSSKEEITVQLYVDFGAIREHINITITFQANQTATAYTILLKANLSVAYEEFPNGKYITSIEGIAENSMYHWIYYVDSIVGIEAADKCDLRTASNQLVNWAYR